MFAIPYFIHNKDKKTIPDTLANDVALGLTQSGYRATSVANPSIESPQSAFSAARQSSPSRILLVRVNKFESGSQIRTEFSYDITFEVYDAKGRLLVESRPGAENVWPLLFRLRLRPQEPSRHHPRGSGRRRLALM